jgi:hypothetical protein
MISYHPESDDRRLLIFHHTGIWLYQGVDRLDKVLNANIPNMNGFILDGHLISRHQRRPGAPTSKYWFLIFDCLASPQNGTAVQGLPHRTRMDYCQSAKDLWRSNQLLELTTRSFTMVTTGPELFSHVRTMLDRRNSLVYNISGLVFTINASSPMIWTFDQYFNFMIRRTLTSLELHTKDGKYTNIDVDYNNPIIQGLPDSTIVKFRWDSSKKLWIPITPVFNITTPDTIKDIDMDNVSETLIRGESFELIKIYHDQILIDTINDIPTVKNILDLTTNHTNTYIRGLRNNKRIDKVILVEPNPEIYNKIMIDRSGKIQVVNYKYNDISSISKIIDKVDLIIFDGNVVDYDTIGLYINKYSPSRLLYIAIDGDIVRHIFLPSGIGNGLDLKDLELGHGKIKLTYNKTLTMNGNIVPLFRSDNILIRHPKYKVKFKRQLSPESTRLLSDSESILSSMYSMGLIEITGNDMLYTDDGYSFIKLVIGS